MTVKEISSTFRDDGVITKPGKTIMKTRILKWSLAVALFNALPLETHGQSFQGLGDLPGSTYSSEANNVSADGRVVVGSSQSNRYGDSTTEAFRWEDGQMTGLGALPLEGSSTRRSVAMGASADGSIVVGSCTGSSERDGTSFRWENGVMTALEVPLGRSGHLAFDVNANGSIIVGKANNYGPGERFSSTGYRWQQGATTELSTGQRYGLARGVSADGSVISLIGGPYDFDEYRPYRWDSGAIQSLQMPAGYKQAIAGRVSANGEFIVGHLSGSSGSVAARWNRTGELLELTTAGEYGMAHDISADGKVVVGQYGSHPNYSAFIWIENEGVRNLREFLIESGLSLEGWKLESAQAISDNGFVIVGNGINPQGQREAWRAEVPEVVLSISTPELSYQPGDSFTATVTVTSFAEETVTVTFAAPLLGEETLSGQASDAMLTIADTELPEPFELTVENPTRSFEVLVQVEEGGVTNLASSLSYTAATGRTGAVSAVEEISVPPLEITLKAKPSIRGKPIVNMLLREDGKVTDDKENLISPKVEVTIENTSGQPVVAFLQKVDPRKRDRSTLPARVRVLGEFPIELGTIAPGTSVKREFDLAIVDDGRFEFNASVSGRIEGTAKGFNAVGRGAPIAVGEPYPVELELKYVPSSNITLRNNGAYFVKPGSGLAITASVKNLTSNGWLEFYGIDAEKHLNAFNAVLTSERGNLGKPPFPHDYTKAIKNQINAGATAVLFGNVLTEAEGAPSGVVRWLGLENAFLVDEATGDRTAVEADDVLMTGDAGGWLGDDLSLRIIQDRRSPIPRQDLSGLERFGAWSEGAQLGIAQWMFDSLDAIGGIGRLAGTISADPSLLSNAMGNGARAVWEGAEMVAFTWENMSPNERDAFVLSAVAEVQSRAFLMAKAPFKADSYEEAYEFTKNATYGLFGGVESAYASNDPRQISEMWGRVSGNIGMEVVTALVPTPKFTAYTKGADAAALAKNSALSESLNIQEDFLRAVSGPVPFIAAKKHWGVGGKNLENIQDLFRRFGIKGYLRERSPSAFRLIDELDEAVWKPELMKPKGLQWTEGEHGELPGLDALLLDGKLPEILGKSGNALPPNGITAIFMPPPTHLLKERLQRQGHSPEIVDAVLARAKLRREEFEDYVPEFKKWARPVTDGGGLPVKKNYKDNGVPDPGDEAGPNREFSFQRHKSPGEPIIYIPQMKNAAGELRYISGDIDWVHFSFLNGDPLDSKTARMFYDAMWKLGLQHPETITWIKKGQTVFAGKINQIAGFLRGEKALLEVTGDSLRAAHINQKLTRFANDGRNHLIFFDSGLKSRAKSTVADIETAFNYFQSKFPDRRIIAPFLWFGEAGDEEPSEGLTMSRSLSAGLDSTVNGFQWSFTTADDAILAREGNGSTTIEVFDGTRWKAVNLAELPKPLALTPATALSSDVPAGATILPIEDLPELWPEEMAGHLTNWFEAGQTIVLAPGESTQEIREVIALGSLILDRPLNYDHPEGTLVAVLPASLAGASETASPKLKLKRLTKRVTNGSYRVAGTTRDNEDVARVEATVNGGAPLVTTPGNLTKGARPFDLAGIPLENGTNTLVVTAVDVSGNRSTAKVVKVHYANLRQELAGNYSGLLASTGPLMNDRVGLLKLKATKTGRFTGNISLGEAVIPITGIFDNAGVAHFGKGGDTATMPTSLALTNGRNAPPKSFGAFELSITAQSVTGTLKDEASFPIAAVTASPALRTVPRNYRGKYTLVFPARTAQWGLQNSDYPQGDGVGTLSVSARGVVKLIGSLADGTKVTASGSLSENYEWPLLARLYNGRGVIAGPVVFDDSHTESDVRGLGLTWIRPALGGAQHYPAGWPDGIVTDLFGAKYTVPAGASVLPGGGTTDPLGGNALLTFHDGGLLSDVVKTINITKRKTVTIPTDNSFKLKLQVSKGLLSGTFLHENALQLGWHGVVYQKGDGAGGYGFFLGPNESGGVTLEGR